MIDFAENRRDPMTGLYHRSLIPRFIAEVVEHSRDDTERLSMIIMDIDDMKAILDYHGLPCGDYVIKEIAGLLAENVPANALLARSGGDEFTIVLPRTAYESAQLLALHLCDVTAAHTFRFKYDHEQEFRQVSVTISAGVAGIHTNVPDATASLMYDLVSIGYESLRNEKPRSNRRPAAIGKPPMSKPSRNSSPTRLKARVPNLRRILRRE